MKASSGKFDEKGQLKHGIVKEFFKDGSVSIVGEYRDGDGKSANGAATTRRAN